MTVGFFFVLVCVRIVYANLPLYPPTAASIFQFVSFFILCSSALLSDSWAVALHFDPTTVTHLLTLINVFNSDGANTENMGYREFVTGLCLFSGGSIRTKGEVMFNIFDVDGNKTLDVEELTIMFRVLLRVGRIKLEVQLRQLEHMEQEVAFKDTALPLRPSPSPLTASAGAHQHTPRTFLRAGQGSKGSGSEWIGGMTGILDDLFSVFLPSHVSLQHPTLLPDSVRYFCSLNMDVPISLTRALRTVPDSRVQDFFTALKPSMHLPSHLQQYARLHTLVRLLFRVDLGWAGLVRVGVELSCASV